MLFEFVPIQLPVNVPVVAFVAGGVIVGGFVLMWLSAGAIADVIVAGLAKLWAMVYRLLNDLPE